MVFLQHPNSLLGKIKSYKISNLKLHTPFMRTLRIGFRFRCIKYQFLLVILRVSKDLAVRRIFTSPDKFFISSRLYKSWAFETLNRNTPSFRSAPVFLPPLYKSFACKTLNANFSFPQVFGLRRLRGNPPCSLWLQSVHWTNCFTRRAHITVPPCNGTHDDRVAGDNSTRLTS